MITDLIGEGDLGWVPFMPLVDMLERLESVETFDGNFSEIDERREWAGCTAERRFDTV